MEELRTKHKSAAHHFALECIQQQDGRSHSTPNKSPILGRALCLTPRGSPVPGRISHLSDKFQDTLTLTSDTDALAAKIGAMFPTVSETHIKILLKKYFNREAVVISALQVEKHPITTPGPLSMTPPAPRLQNTALGIYSMLQLVKEGYGSVHGSNHFTPLSGTPHGSPMLLRPASGASSYYGTNKTSDGQPTRHHSPKMKLKYLKSIFPKAEETLILHVLANKDNNVQKASEDLLGMGFSRKENVVVARKKEKETPLPPKKVVTIMRTPEEKNLIKQQFQKKYNTVPEGVVSIALESVAYNEERAKKILTAVMHEEEPPKAKVEVKEAKPTAAIDVKKIKEYMPWNGPGKELCTGKAVKPEGPEPREKKPVLARGSANLAKGPSGLAKGSIYQTPN